jgi:hypothetical protein
MAEGRYDLYFHIDPHNAIDEIHEDWNTTTYDPNYDPGGNNTGRYPFAVTEPSSNVLSVASAESDSGAAQDGSFSVVIDGMSPADFRDSLSGRTEDFRAYGTVTFLGDEPLKNVYVEIVGDHPDEAGVQRLVANRYIPAIFPLEQTHFSFIASPSQMREADLRLTLSAHNAVFPTEIDREEQDLPKQSGDSDVGCDSGFGAAGIIVLLAGLRITRGRKNAKK